MGKSQTPPAYNRSGQATAPQSNATAGTWAPAMDQQWQAGLVSAGQPAQVQVRAQTAPQPVWQVANPAYTGSGDGSSGAQPFVDAGTGGAFAPPAPSSDYVGDAIATANSGKYNEIGPTGAVQWTLRPGADPRNPQPGDYIKTTALAPGQQALYNQTIGNQLQAGLVGGSQLKDLQGGQQAQQDALYRRATQYYDRQFGNQEDSLRSRLQNQGLVEGSAAWNNAMQDFAQRKDTAYADATDRAIIGSNQSQNDAVARLASILAMSRGQSPTGGGAGGQTDLLGAAQAQNAQNLARQNADNAASAQSTSDAMSLAMLGYLAFSDRDLKSEIVEVPGGKEGLQAYEYNIQGRRERGYMADEVLQVKPSAVALHESGYLTVDYDQLGGRP